MSAVDFIFDSTPDQRAIIRANWSTLGYQYWFTAELVEYWKHPQTGHVAEMATY